MITSRQVVNIIESYASSGQYRGHHVEIFENPSSSDFISIEKSAREDNRKFESLRFIVDSKNKKVYVWDGYLALHDEARQSLGLPKRYDKTPWLVNGMTSVRDGKIVPPKIWDCQFPGSSFNQAEMKWFYGDMLKCEWAWADKYISNFTNIVMKRAKDNMDRL